ncbi:ABC-2 family transporter protein [Streptomyces sp. L7]
MGGWDSSDVLLIPATRMMAHGLMVLFLGRMHGLGRYIQEGRIDIYLVRPDAGPPPGAAGVLPTNAIGDPHGGGRPLMVGALSRSHLDWTAGRIAYLIAALIGGMLPEAALFTTVVLRPRSASPSADYWSRWIEDLLGTFGNYPLNVLPRAVGGFLTYGLPLAFVAFLPAAVLTGHGHDIGVPYWLAASSPLVGLPDISRRRGCCGGGASATTPG